MSRKVTVYSKDPCQQCDATKRRMKSKEIEYIEDDATAPENLEFIMGLGHKAAPVVTVESDGVIVDHWYGYNPDKIDALV